jgi:hypothetical protein
VVKEVATAGVLSAITAAIISAFIFYFYLRGSL